jgi:hypothetical protein
MRVITPQYFVEYDAVYPETLIACTFKADVVKHDITANSRVIVALHFS